MKESRSAPMLVTGRGLFWSLASALLWGTTFIVGRHLIGGGRTDPVTLAVSRFTIGGALLFAFGLAFHRKALLGVSRGDLVRLALLATVGIVGMCLFLFYGQAETTAINSSIIMQLNPLIILVLGLAIGESLTRWKVIGMLVGLLGCLMALSVVLPGGFAYDRGHLRGDLLVLASAACWAVYSVMSKPVVRRVGGLAAMAWAMVFGAAELIVIRLLMPAPAVWPGDGASVAMIIYLAVLPTAVAFFAWYEAMNCLDLSLLNVMQYLTPPFTILLARLLLGERMTPANLAGVAVVIAGVALTGRGPARPAEEAA